VKRGACVNVSDSRLKKEIVAATNSYSLLFQLEPKKFKYKDSVTPGGKFMFGFLADDVVQIIPEIIDTTSQGYLTMNYEGLIPLLVGALKEQKTLIDSLLSQNASSARNINNDEPANTSLKEANTSLKEIEDLKRQINEIKSECCSRVISTPALSNATAIIADPELMLQNYPNPFDNSTTIKYKLPQNKSGRADIKIFDLKGEEKLSYLLNREESQIVITPFELINGMYLYSLVVENEIIATKNMIISR
jgi:hypothetical protein